MDFSYTREQQALIARVKELYEFIRPFELECEMNNGLSAETHETIRKAVLAADLQAVNMPREWGGAELSTFEQILYHEQLGGLTNALWDTVWRPANALRACTPEQRERYLIPGIQGLKRDAIAVTEEDAGSDPLAMTTRAEWRGDRYVLNGEKWFVTVGDVAAFILTLAWVDDKPTLFIVDRDAPGLSIKRTPRYTHTFVYEHPEFVYEDVELGPEQVLGEVGQGYELIRDWFVEERLMIGARTVGASARAISESVDFAKVRSPGRRTHHQPPTDPGDAGRHGGRHHCRPRVGLPSWLRGRARKARPQGVARQGSRGEAGCVRGRWTSHRQGGADPRWSRLHA